VDVAGTMVGISIYFYLGFKAVWLIHILWGSFCMAIFMAYQAKYIRQSGVMTLAEWHKTRFGDNRETEYLRIAIMAFQVILLMFALTFAAVGTTKFAENLFPIAPWLTTLIIFSIVGLYVTFGGFFGVILTDFFQTILIILGAIIITCLAFNVPREFSVLALKDPDWSSLLPSWKLWESYQSATPSSYHQFQAFGPLLIAGICFGTFKMLAGPLTWDFNFFLSTKSARQASLAAGVWTFAHIVRWFIILSFVVLGAYYLGGQAGFDGEKIMPLVLTKLPVGLAGLFMAILLAALMSTISAIINTTSNVVLNDVLKRYFIKNFPEQKLVRIGMVVSMLVMVTAYLLSFFYKYIVSAWEFIQYALLMMIHVPASLRWHWWRFGAKAYVWSMIASTGVVVIQRLFFAGIPQYAQLFMVVGSSLALTIIITLLTTPASFDLLIKFYSRIRPFGFWKPIRLEAVRLGLVPATDKMPRMDLINSVLTLSFQLSIGIMPLYIIFRKWDYALIWFGVCILSAIILYFTWFKNLPKEDE